MIKNASTGKQKESNPRNKEKFSEISNSVLKKYNDMPYKPGRLFIAQVIKYSKINSWMKVVSHSDNI